MKRRSAFCAAAAGLLTAAFIAGIVRGADDGPRATFKQYCFQCHGGGRAMGGMSLEQLLANKTVGDGFARWERVAAALDEHRMPPKGLPQPPDADRQQAVSWVRAELRAFTNQNAGDPGRVTVRRLTSGEYAYAIHDLTGLDLDLGIDASTDSVGGEGFTNFGDVQFMQDASLERYLAAAKKVADHAVIGSGPIEFFHDPGDTGFEMSAIARIKDIYDRYGFRTVSGEGGFPYGLDRYGKVFYVAWRYRHRAALGEPNATLDSLAAREGITGRFARHIWTVVNSTSLGYPSSEAGERWRKLPAPPADARAACDELQKWVTGWPLWLFARGDQAVGGQGDESPLIINEKSLTLAAKKHFTFNRFAFGGRGAARPAGPAKVFLNAAAVNPTAAGKPVIVWRNAVVAYRFPGGPAPDPTPAGDQPPVRGRGQLRPKQPLRAVVSEDTAKQLGFGVARDGATVGPDDFASEPSASFEVPLPQGAIGFEFQADAEIGSSRDQVFRIVITDREDGTSRGIPVRGLIGDPASAGYRKFRDGVLEWTRLLPPNSQFEPTPADKDPIPEPFDSAYNVPEHDEFDTRVKYVRDDRFIYDNILDDAARARVDQAWNDLYASFAYHDNYLDLIAKHFQIDLKGKHIGDLSPADIDALQPEPRKYAKELRKEYDGAMAAQAAARPKRVDDCLRFASLAWRRPLTDAEKQGLRGFYDRTVTTERDPRAAVRAVLARVLVSPAFLYRAESPRLTGDDLASRLSFFLWSSLPDDELRRAAAAGDLEKPEELQRQVRRMLADPKARRLATEFFGQWLGFYHFDQHRGVDTARFPEFTDDVRAGMYDEAVSFFEHIIRKDRPVRDILYADYDFLSKPLAKFYGVDREIKSADRAELIEGANLFHRGGVLRLGAVLAVTSAPLRTSPVKRGDWVLRRILGINLPPPPADAGSIPADDRLFGGLSLREKLEAHKRNATCASCHLRIDPLGFPLERFDATGRWRDKYADGKPIEDRGALADKTEISGVDGLLNYLSAQDEQVRRTLARKLLGYALGRTIQPSDTPLIDRIAAAGSDATFSQFAIEVALSRQFRNRAANSDKVGVQ
jgi:hypothetical protein